MNERPGETGDTEAGRRRRSRVRRRDRALAAAAAISAHLLIVLALLNAAPRPLKALQPEAIAVDLTPRPQLEPPTPRRERPAKATAPAAPSVKPIAEPPPPAPHRAAQAAEAPESLPASPAPQPLAALSESQLAGAITAGSGGGGGGAGGGGRGCDMVRRLQDALRRDGRVLAAIRAAGGSGRAVLVWNGDWIRNGSEDGKGLASVRQAIAVEVAFAPEACRAEPVHGLVLISLNDGPGSSRLALGSGDWRWSDLLFAR
jgi:hypothetical protein